MLKLFTYEGYKINIEPEALMLVPIKKIWERDKSKTKDTALKELAFIYFYSDPRSDYQYILDPIKRKKEIKLGEDLPEEWEIDDDLQEAISFYESFIPISASLLQDTKMAINKVRLYLRDIDLHAVDDKGKPIHTINSITSAIKLIPSLVKDLQDAEKALNSEILSNSKMRGNAEKSISEYEY